MEVALLVEEEEDEVCVHLCFAIILARIAQENLKGLTPIATAHPSLTM